MKIRDIREGLPPHLAKHFDSEGAPLKGSWKDGKWTADKKQPPKKKSKWKDVTPKGYGPDESIEEDQNDPVYASYLISMEKYSFPNNQAQLDDTQYVRVDFRVRPGGSAHPLSLRRQIDEHPKIKKLTADGYSNQKTVASWKKDPKAELADYQDRLEREQQGQLQMSPGEKLEAQKQVKSLQAAIDIMSSKTVHEGQQSVEEMAHMRHLEIFKNGEMVTKTQWVGEMPAHQLLIKLIEMKRYFPDISEIDLRSIARDLHRNGNAQANEYEFRIDARAPREM